MLKRDSKGFTLIELLIVVAIIGIIAAIAIPNLLNAIDRGKQKRTMADMRSIGTAIESYAVDNNVYPATTTIGTLQSIVQAGAYMKNMPIADGWNNAFVVDSVTTEYTLLSTGKDGTGAASTCVSGQTTTFIDQSLSSAVSSSAILPAASSKPVHRRPTARATVMFSFFGHYRPAAVARFGSSSA
jgi:general secretion pathway protein G